MNINLKIIDQEVDHPELGTVPVVAMDIESDEAPTSSEPTPAMWTAACIYSLHVSGKLMELTKNFIASKEQEAAGIVEGSGDGVVGD